MSNCLTFTFITSHGKLEFLIAGLLGYSRFSLFLWFLFSLSGFNYFEVFTIVFYLSLSVIT